MRAVDLTVHVDGRQPRICRAQCGSKREIVIVDDGSTDGTRDILSAGWPSPARDMKIVFHAQNGGKGAALRTGFEQATGDILVIQDADLEYDPRDYVKLLEPHARRRARPSSTAAASWAARARR